MQIARSLLPKVHLSHKDKGYGFDVLADRYADLPMEALIIDAHLVTPYIPPVHIDGILSQAVLTAHPCAPRFDAPACVVPLPVELLWVSDKGLPLWAVSEFREMADAAQCREYWHKRYPSHRAEFGEKMNAVTTAGRYKEYRVPVNARRVERLRAFVIGNQAELERLLGYVSHIGKKGAMGYGRVARWDVKPLGQGLSDLAVINGRPVPAEFAREKGLTGTPMPNVAWTSPYWYAPWWSDCVCLK